MSLGSPRPGVYFLGLGPGEPQLLSMRAHQLLAAASVIFAPEEIPWHIEALASPGAAWRVAHRAPEVSATELAACDHEGAVILRLFWGDGWAEGGASLEASALSALGVLPEIVSGPSSTLTELARSGRPARLDATPVTLEASAPVAWYSRRPLHGMRVIVTRSAHQSAGMIDALRALGAEPVPCPVIEIRRPADVSPLQEAIHHLSRYQWVIFTSVNGVDRFFEALFAAGRDARALGGAQLACIGPGTARGLRRWGLSADLLPDGRYVAEGLLDALDDVDVSGERILLPRAEVAREVLPETLRARGARVDVVPVYTTTSGAPAPEHLGKIKAGEVDVVTLTASSTATGFRALFDDVEWPTINARLKAACIGPVTAETAAGLGMEVALTAQTFTVPGLIEALVQWWRQ